MAQRRIVLADDDQQILSFFKASLKAQDFQVHEAGDGRRRRNSEGTWRSGRSPDNGHRNAAIGGGIARHSRRRNVPNHSGVIHFRLDVRPARLTGMEKARICIPQKAIPAQSSHQVHRTVARTPRGEGRDDSTTARPKSTGRRSARRLGDGALLHAPVRLGRPACAGHVAVDAERRPHVATAQSCGHGRQGTPPASQQDGEHVNAPSGT